MKSIADILKEAEVKAKQMAADAEVKLKQAASITSDDITSDTAEAIREKLSQAAIDDILKSTVEKFLSGSSKTKKKYKTSSKPEQSGEKKTPKVEFLHLDLDQVLSAYRAMELKPCKPEYWFYEDRKHNPLIQCSIVSDDGTYATPLAAFVLYKRKELLKLPEPPSYVTTYDDLTKPSHQWSAGRLSQVSGLDISYVLGFGSGYAGNHPGHPGCSTRYHTGYQDGLKIRNQIIEKKLIDPDPAEDIYLDERDEGVLSELSRIRGYSRGGV